MSARLVFLDGDVRGKEIWIEKRVIRVGSDPKNDVCVPSPDVSERELTVEYRDGQYTAYNRSDGQLTLDDVRLPHGESAIWSNNTSVRLSNGMELLLEQFGSGAPEKQQTQTIADGTDHSPNESDGKSATEDAAPTESKSKMAMQLAVIAACFIGTILLGFFVLKPTPVANTNSQSTGSSLSTRLNRLVAERPDSDTIRTMAKLLSAAEFAKLRGDSNASQLNFRLLHEALTSNQLSEGPTNESDGSAGTGPEHKLMTELLEYVRQQRVHN